MSAPPTGPRTEGGQHVSTEQGPRPHRVLVLNSGSSSVKYQLLDMADSSRLAVGLVERIGEETSRIVHTPLTEGTGGEREVTGRVADHQAALETVAAELAEASGVDPGLRRSGALMVARDRDEAQGQEHLKGIVDKLGQTPAPAPAPATQPFNGLL